MTHSRALGLAIVIVAFWASACSRPAPKKDREELSLGWDHAKDLPAQPAPRSAADAQAVPHPGGWVAPRLVRPADGHAFSEDELAREQGLIVLTWSAAGSGARYELDLSRDRNFFSLARKLPVSRGIALIRGLGEGEYFWRVRVLGSSGARVDLESNVQKFRVGESSSSRPSEPL